MWQVTIMTNQALFERMSNVIDFILNFFEGELNTTITFCLLRNKYEYQYIDI